MPWKVTCEMDERYELIRAAFESGSSVAHLCRRFDVSRKTFYKWRERFLHEGVAGLQDRSRAPHSSPGAIGLPVVNAGLQDRSRAPHSSPGAIGLPVVNAVLRLKGRYPDFGAPKIRVKLLQELGAALTPCESSIGNILSRHGLTSPRRKRRRATPNAQPLSHCDAVNQVWSADFKGWFHCGNGAKCTPLTISDAHSRYLIRCVGLAGKTGFEVVRPFFESAFRELGMPAALRTDNGPPFAGVGLGGLSSLAVWLIRLGIHPERIRPGRPQENGRHERMHRTLKKAVCNPPKPTLKKQQQAFDQFLTHYNFDRPHEALGQRPPAEIYHRSARQYPERLPEAREYPFGWQVRRIDTGTFRWDGNKIYLSRPLSGETIGLEPIDNGIWRLWFEHHALCEFDERQQKLQALRDSTK